MGEILNRELGQLGEAVRHLKDGMDRMECRMDAGFTEIKETMVDRFKDHSVRLGSLERWRSWLKGGLAILGIVVASAGVIFAVVTWALRG